jgi:hypothetical protein
VRGRRGGLRINGAGEQGGEGNETGGPTTRESQRFHETPEYLRLSNAFRSRFRMKCFLIQVNQLNQREALPQPQAK